MLEESSCNIQSRNVIVYQTAKVAMSAKLSAKLKFKLHICIFISFLFVFGLLVFSELSWIDWIWPGQYLFIARQCWHTGCQRCSSKMNNPPCFQVTHMTTVILFYFCTDYVSSVVFYLCNCNWETINFLLWYQYMLFSCFSPTVCRWKCSEKWGVWQAEAGSYRRFPRRLLSLSSHRPIPRLLQGLCGSQPGHQFGLNGLHHRHPRLV